MLFLFNSVGQSIPCGATAFSVYGNVGNEEVMVRFIGVNNSLYTGNPQEYLYLALNSTNAYIDAAIVQIVAVNGVAQDGPATYVAPNSAAFKSILGEALIWNAAYYWNFEFAGQSELNIEQNDFQQIDNSEWQQEAGIVAANLVNYATILGPIEDDWPSSDVEGAQQIGQFVAEIQDVIDGYSQLQTAFGGNSANILSVLQNYNVVSGQNFSSSQLIVGLANLNPSQLQQFESDLYSAAYPGNTLESSTQQYLTSFLENLGAGAQSLGEQAAVTGAFTFYEAYATYGLSASTTAQLAVSQVNDFIADGLPGLALTSAASTIIQSYVLPQADILEDMVGVQNILIQKLFPEFHSVSGQMTGSNGLGNFDNGRALFADVEAISSFESMWTYFGIKEEQVQIVQTQLGQYLAFEPAFMSRATNMFGMLQTANSLSQTIANQSVAADVPVASGLSETSGTLGNEITINGNNLCNIYSVYFNNQSTWSSVNSANNVSTVVPAGSGTANVCIVGPGGISQTVPFTYSTTTSSVTNMIIALSGDLNFGNVVVGNSASSTITIFNNGNYPMTVAGLSGLPSGFSDGGFSGTTIPAGQSINVTITFQPAAAIGYSGTVTVNANFTSGSNTISASGTGISGGTFSFGPLLVSPVTQNAATLNIVIFPAGGPQTTIDIKYGPVGGNTNMTYAYFVIPAGATQKIHNGPDTISGLSSSQQYMFYLEAINSEGTVKSQAVVVETEPPGSEPTIQQATASPTTNTVTFTLVVSPNQQTTLAGITGIEGPTIFNSPVFSVPASDSQQTITWTATGLPANTPISWQGFSSNYWGFVSTGPEATGTMPLPPNVLSTLITNLAPASVQLDAVIDANGADTQCSVVATNMVTDAITNTPFTDIGSGSIPANIALGLSGLSPATLYNASIIVTNSSGTSTSLVFQFTTSPLLPPTLAITVSNAVANLTFGAAEEMSVLEMTTNLSIGNWTPIATNTAIGSVQISPGNGLSCFFRAEATPQ